MGKRRKRCTSRENKTETKSYAIIVVKRDTQKETAREKVWMK